MIKKDSRLIVECADVLTDRMPFDDALVNVVYRKSIFKQSARFWINCEVFNDLEGDKS